MNKQSIIQQMKHWGYYLLPKSHPQSPGYPGLLVAVRETPTEEHFDPQSMRVLIVDTGRTVRCVTLRSKAAFNHSVKVVLGPVSLQDRFHKRVNFFTFGGLLESVTTPGATFYVLNSPAPVLDLNGRQESIADQFAFEVEALIAMQEAKWGTNSHGFLQRLSEIDPFRLYLLSLQALLQHCQQSSRLHNQYQNLCSALLHEKEWLLNSGLYPALPYDLDGALAPKSRPLNDHDFSFSDPAR